MSDYELTSAYIFVNFLIKDLTSNSEKKTYLSVLWIRHIFLRIPNPDPRKESTDMDGSLKICTDSKNW